ncbi:MAG: extracellular solute-binding protein [Streptosporangiales bacterium]|nr:extracellular solute-binding protein [Streptosporangiales bacterium]
MSPNKPLAWLAGAIAAVTLTACGTGAPSPAGKSSSAAKPSASVLAGGSSCSSSSVKLTFWAWVPGINRAVNKFNQTHPGICVTLEDPGAGEPEYTALTNAMKAGSGAPDVAEIEFDELPSFEIQHYVKNLVPYGAGKYQKDFAPWAWSQVSQGGGVYAMPSDFGPMGFYYDQKTLAKYHVTPPKTWADFATDAAKVHRQNPKATLADFPVNDAQWLMDMMSQAGAWPFQYNGGSNITINWTGPKQEAFAAYWQKLISAGAVSTITDQATQQYTALDSGTIAAALDSAWAPSYFAANAKRSTGQWRAAPLPQWTAGANVAADWGGSTYPVLSASKHPKEAAEFAEWLTATDQSWNIVKTPPSSLFPTYLKTLQSKSFTSLAYPVSGKSQPNQVFSAGALTIPKTPWPPFMTQLISQEMTTVGGVMNGKETLKQAFAAIQQQEVSYAKAQGFKVST